MKQIENLKKKKLLTLCHLITRARPGSLALASLSLALASLLLALASLSLTLSLSSDQQFSDRQVLCYIFSPRNAKPTQAPPSGRPEPPRRPQGRDARLVLLEPRPQLGQLVPPRVPRPEPVKVRGQALGLGRGRRRRGRGGDAARGDGHGARRDPLGGAALPLALLAARHQRPAVAVGGPRGGRRGELGLPLEVADPAVEPGRERGVPRAEALLVGLDPQLEPVRRVCCCFLAAAGAGAVVAGAGAGAVVRLSRFLLPVCFLRRGGKGRQVQRRGRARGCRARQGLQGLWRGERDDGGALRSGLKRRRRRRR